MRTPEKEYLIAEAADFMNVCAQTLRRWDEAGWLVPGRNKQGYRRYKHSALVKYKAKRSVYLRGREKYAELRSNRR